MMTAKMVMVNAWKIAKWAEKKHGGKAIEYIAESMKIAWKKYHEARKARGGQMVGIEPGFLTRKVGTSAANQINNSPRLAIIKQTVKAYFVEYDVIDHKGKVVDTGQIWTPKSMCI